MKGLFVTGTDTAVGKTHISMLILRNLRTSGVRVGAYKPVCSGAIVDVVGNQHWEDIDRLRDALATSIPDDAICPQRFSAAVSPPYAAMLEGRTVDADLLVAGLQWWCGKADAVIVEGAGGLLSPVTDRETVADLAVSIRFPLLLVARCGLGTINHTLLSIEAARRRGLTVIGIVMNQCHPADDRSLAESNAAEIESRGQTPVLGILDWGSTDGLHRHGRPVTIAWSDLASLEK
jgi:dethiobiotin synthetase